MISDVDAYIAAAPKPAREKLAQLRKIILSVVPDATERISYQMPYYAHDGHLAYFGLCRHHIGLYVPPPAVAELKRELEGYVTTKSAVHLPLDRKLPVRLIKKLIKARIKINKERAAAKRSR